jgi:hypothetical protein
MSKPRRNTCRYFEGLRSSLADGNRLFGDSYAFLNTLQARPLHDACN